MALPRIRLNRVTGQSLPPVQPFKEQGTSGTAIYAGFISVKDKSPKWNRVQRYAISSEIAVNVSIVAASIRHFLNLISHPEWSLVPSDDDDPEAVELADFMSDVMYDMKSSFRQVVRRAATFPLHGFGIQEWKAKKREDGAIGYEDIESRPQHTIERWEPDEAGSIVGVWQRSPQDQTLYGLPRGKLLYLVDDTLTDSPEGMGLFRSLLEPYTRLKQYLALEARAFERDLRGTPIGRAPLAKLRELVAAGGLEEDKASELIQGMKDFIELQVKESNTGMLLDSQPFESTAADGPKISPVLQWDMQLMQGSSNGLEELSHAIDRLQREMARILGTEHLMMGDAGGNRALSADKSRNLYLTSNAILSSIVEGANRDIIDPIWALNSLPEDKKPEFTVEDVTFKSIEEITTSLKDLASSGAVLAPDDPAINDVRDLLGVSRYVPSEMMMGATEPVATPDAEEDPDAGVAKRRITKRRIRVGRNRS